MRRFLFAAGGLLGAVLLLLQLMKMSVIELGFMSPSWGLWLIPVLLVAGPAAGFLFARAKSWLAGVLVLLLLAVIPIGLELQSEVGTGHGPVGRRAMQQRVTDLKGAAVAAATREFGPGSRQVQEECGNSCRGVIVSVAGDGRRVWYWYVNGQLDTVLDRERLQSELAPILPPGAQVTGLDGGSDPWRLTFTYAGPSGESQGRVWLRTPNERLSLWSVELEGRLPVEFMLPLRTGDTYWEVRRAAALRRIRAYNAVLAAHGQEVDAIRFGSDTYGRCEQVLVRVNRSQPVWYWYDDREGRVLARAPLERVAERIIPWLPPGSRVTSVDDDPWGERIWLNYRDGDGKEGRTVAFIAIEKCQFAIGQLGGAGRRIDLNLPLN